MVAQSFPSGGMVVRACQLTGCTRAQNPPRGGFFYGKKFT
ncbi:hypothetical protein CSB69_3209 [Morganella morganii]|nr:hypothetical protein CSB69_3209 [Morganella morganii]EMP53360.1 hypothetical protein C790_01551 [Morganella morganii SC01]